MPRQGALQQQLSNAKPRLAAPRTSLRSLRRSSPLRRQLHHASSKRKVSSHRKERPPKRESLAAVGGQRARRHLPEADTARDRPAFAAVVQASNPAADNLETDPQPETANFEDVSTEHASLPVTLHANIDDGSSWWRQLQDPSEDRSGTLCNAGRTALLDVEVAGVSSAALLDSGASRSFVNPSLLHRVPVRVKLLDRFHKFTLANKASLVVDRCIEGLPLWCGPACLTANFLVAPVPFDLVLGIDWLDAHCNAWYFNTNELELLVGQTCHIIPVRRYEQPVPTGTQPEATT